MAKAMISSKGQITIPVSLRRKFDLYPHQHVEISAEEDGIKLRRISTIEENAQYFTSLIQPGTKPVTDVHKYIEENWDGEH